MNIPHYYLGVQRGDFTVSGDNGGGWSGECWCTECGRVHTDAQLVNYPERAEYGWSKEHGVWIYPCNEHGGINEFREALKNAPRLNWSKTKV